MRVLSKANFAAESTFAGPPAQRRGRLCGMPLQGILTTEEYYLPIKRVLGQAVEKAR